MSENQDRHPIATGLVMAGICFGVMWAIYQFSWLPFREEQKRKDYDHCVEFWGGTDDAKEKCK